VFLSRFRSSHTKRRKKITAIMIEIERAPAHTHFELFWSDSNPFPVTPTTKSFLPASKLLDQGQSARDRHLIVQKMIEKVLSNR